MTDNADTGTEGREQQSMKQIIDMMREYVEKRQTGQLVISSRLDFLVSKIGVIEELAHRVDGHDSRIEDMQLAHKTMVGIVEYAQDDFDSRTQLVLRDFEQLRKVLTDASAAFQQAQEHQNSDWDEKWMALQHAIQDIESRQNESAAVREAIVVAKIGRSQAIAVSLLVLIGSIVTALVTLAIANSGGAP